MPARSQAVGYRRGSRPQSGRRRPVAVITQDSTNLPTQRCPACQSSSWSSVGRIERVFGGYQFRHARLDRVARRMGADTCPHRAARAPRLPRPRVARARPVRARHHLAPYPQARPSQANPSAANPLPGYRQPGRHEYSSGRVSRLASTATTPPVVARSRWRPLAEPDTCARPRKAASDALGSAGAGLAAWLAEECRACRMRSAVRPGRERGAGFPGACSSRWHRSYPR
jgi:hypothetical protein